MTQSTGQFPPGYTPGHMWAQTDTPFLKLQDTQGQEEYDQGTKLSLQNVHTIIVCFSLIEPDSFKNVKDKWLKLYSKYLRSDTHVMLVGTKMDLREDADEIEKLKARGLLPITREEGESLAKELKAVKYMECSAYTKVGLQEVFDEIFKITHQLEQVGDGTRWSQKQGTLGRRWRHLKRNADLREEGAVGDAAGQPVFRCASDEVIN